MGEHFITAKSRLIGEKESHTICVPLGVSSLKTYVEGEGHHVDLLDFNTNDQIFKLQNKYFLTVLKIFPFSIFLIWCISPCVLNKKSPY
jgi:hypothetical protein